MARQIIFTTSIITSILKNENLEKEILKELQTHEDLKQGRVRSNFGGFQTNDITNKSILEPLGNETVRLIFENYKIKANKINMNNLWINKNYKNNFNNLHVHPRCHLSAVYYVDVSEKGGELVFRREDCIFTEQNLFIPNDMDFDDSFTIKPKKNLLIIFPSHLKHMVQPHEDDRPRISVSFNIGFENG